MRSRPQLRHVRLTNENDRARLRGGMTALIYGGVMAILGISLAVAGQIPYDIELVFGEVVALAFVAIGIQLLR